MSDPSLGYASYGSPQDQAIRLAAAQLQEGSSTAPIRSKWQGAARLANAVMGGLGMRQAQQGAMNSNAAALKLAGAMSGGGMGGAAAGGGGLPAAPGALAGLENDPDIQSAAGVNDATFDGLKDSDIMGGAPAAQMGPPMPPMAPGNAAGGAPPGGPAPGGALPAGGAGAGSMMGALGLPPQGVQVASNDPNFAPQPQQQPGFSAPSPANSPQGNGGGFNPDDLAMFQADMQAAPGSQGGGGSPGAQQGGGAGGDALSALKANIANTESRGQPNGGYGAVGPATSSGDRALGKYQVMGANVPQWTQAALGQSLTPQQFLASPEAQEAVVNHRLGGYLQQYGPDGAARAWFTGSPTGKGADVNGMTGDRYAALATQGMTPGQSNFLASSVAGPGAPSAIGQPPPQNDEQMFQQDEQAVPAQQSQQQQSAPQGGGIPPQTMDGIKQILMNPYASPEAKQMATSMMQRYLQPQWETVNRPDGSVIAYNKNNPSQNQVIGQPVRPSTFTQIGVDASGNPRYGFVNPATGQIQPADAQGGAGAGAPAASPYVPRTVGNPPNSVTPGNVPAPNPAWTPQPAQGGPPPAGQSAKPNSIATPDYTVKRTPGEDAIDQMAANDSNPANAALYTRARNIMLGNEPAPLIGVAGTKPVDIATMNVVRQADPNFNSAVATQRAENIKSWQDKTTPTSAGGQLLAANTSLAHMGTLADASDDLAQSQSGLNSQAINGLQGWAASNNLPMSGGTPVAAKRAAYEAALQPVTEELTKLYSGGPGAEGDRERMISQLSPDAPTAVRQAAMKTLTTLLGGKVQSLQNQWSQAGFAAPFPTLDTDSQNTLQRILGPQQGGQPGSGQGQAPGQAQQQAPAGGGGMLDQARAAIAKGAPRSAVIQRLQKMGIDPSGL